jgi:hypothetical protein
MLEAHGVRVAAISYDSIETLRGFADKRGIGLPLLSDEGSAVIRRFGIFNTNMATDLRSYGVPHPVEYLVSPDGVVVRKYFVPNYQHRVSASAVAIREFGAEAPNETSNVIVCSRDELVVTIGLASSTAFAGQQVGFVARFALAAGWHVYGSPLPEGYTATSITFDDSKILSQSLELPPASPLRIAALDEVLPVYTGSFEAIGSLLLKFPLEAGQITLSGNVRFQLCSDTVCEPPESIPFEVALTLQPFVVATAG